MTQIVNPGTMSALNKLPLDGTCLSIRGALDHSEEIYFYYHLKELGYVHTNAAEGTDGVEICITEKGKMIIQQIQHFHAYSDMISSLYPV